MNSNFQVSFKRRNGNLHIFARGDFDGNSAWELVNLLHDQYDGKGEVVIHTHQLREMCPFGCSTFQCRLNLRKVPADRLRFEGPKGFDIAPTGTRVSTTPHRDPCRCNGNCAHCRCHDGKHGDA